MLLDDTENPVVLEPKELPVLLDVHQRSADNESTLHASLAHRDHPDHPDNPERRVRVYFFRS